ncbi:hypothetical protein I6A60_00535 [Frankia sp. AgB1.9]|nr:MULTISPECIES: hypothetical protein [unclassified Frankia]MBL7546375.1 hypothetical protein [Frankia sp. AgB1.9]MBL7618580.1 hypothetical protein [Frankia sp. AgB1.8]
MVILADVAEVEKRADGAGVLAKAAATVILAGLRDKALAQAGERDRTAYEADVCKSMGIGPGPVAQLLDRAQQLLDMSAYDRAAEVTEARRIRDLQGHGGTWRMWDGRARNLEAEHAAVPLVKTVTPKSAPVVDTNAITKAVLEKAMKPLTDQLDRLAASMAETRDALEQTQRPAALYKSPGFGPAHLSGPGGRA